MLKPNQTSGPDSGAQANNRKRYVEMVDALPEYERTNFTSRILNHFSEQYPFEFREVLVEEFLASKKKEQEGHD